METFLLPLLSKIFGFFSQLAVTLLASVIALSAALKLRRSMRLIGLCALSFIYAAPAWSQGGLDGVSVYIEVESEPGKVLDHSQDGSHNAYVYQLRRTSNQLFILKHQGDGYYSIQSGHLVNGSRYCLDIEPKKSNAYFYPCHNGHNQQFEFYVNKRNLHFSIIPRSDPDQCLDVHKQNLYIYKCHNGENQQFTFVLTQDVEAGRRNLQEIEFISKVKEGLGVIGGTVEDVPLFTEFATVLPLQLIHDGSKLKQAYHDGEKQIFIEILECPGFLFKHVYGSPCWDKPIIEYWIRRLADNLFSNHHSQAKSAPRVKAAIVFDPGQKLVKGYLKLQFGKNAIGNNDSADIIRGLKSKNNNYVNMSDGSDNKGKEILIKMKAKFCPADAESSKAPSLVLSVDGISILFSEIQGHEGLYPTVVKIDQHHYLYTYDKDGNTIVLTPQGVVFSGEFDLCDLKSTQAVYHKDMGMLELWGKDQQSIFWDKNDAVIAYLYSPRQVDSRYTSLISLNKNQEDMLNKLLDSVKIHKKTTIPFRFNQWLKKSGQSKVGINQQGVSKNSKAIKKLPVRKDNFQSGNNKGSKLQVVQKLKSKKSKDNEFYCRMTAQGPMDANLPPAKQSERLFVEQHTAVDGNRVGCFTLEVAGAGEGNHYQYGISELILELDVEAKAVDCDADNLAVPVVEVRDDNYQCAIGANRQKITIFL